MTHWMRDNKKQLLAFFMVALMVAFLLPTSFQGCGPNDLAIGSINRENVYMQDVLRAYNEWEFLSSRVVIPMGQGADQQWTPIIRGGILGVADAQIEKNKTLYYLLQHEARQLGAAPSPGRLDGVLQMVGVVQQDRSIMSYEDIKDTEEGRFVRYAVGNALAVESLFRRAANAIKVSQPQLVAESAMELQALNLRLVDFPAAGFLAGVPAPSEEQLQAQFKSYADKLAGNPTEENPFGFGYRLPNRIKFQSIVVPEPALRKAVLSRKSEYDWDVEARQFYSRNQRLFPATQPTTQPGPSTRPYDEVKADALEQIVRPEIERLQGAVLRRITSAMTEDFAAFNRAAPTTGTAGPATKLGPAYNTFEYLQALSADVAKQFGVELKLFNGGDELRSEEELRKLTDVATAYAMVQGQATDFARYALDAAAPLHPDAAGRDLAYMLSLYQPSPTLSDLTGSSSATIFRITAAEASHTPSTLAEVRDKVEQDLRTKLAFEAAALEAEKLTQAPDFSAAAAAAGRAVVDAPDVRLGLEVRLPELTLSPFGQFQFTRQAFDLLSEREAATPARTVIKLHRDGRVLAAELAGVVGAVPEQDLAFMQTVLARQLTAQRMQGLAMNWFDYDNVVKRVGFVDPDARPAGPSTTP